MELVGGKMGDNKKVNLINWEIVTSPMKNVGLQLRIGCI